MSPDDEPTSPGVIPSSSGIVATAGKVPLNHLLDLNGDGIPDWEQKWFRDTIAGWIFMAVARIFPGSPWALMLLKLQPEVQQLIDTGAK